MLRRFPPINRLWVVLEVLRIEKVAEVLSITSFATVTERAVLPEKRNSAAAPPLPMVKLLTETVASITTVCPLDIVTLFVLLGTPAGVQIAGLLQFPLPLDILFCE